MTRSVHRRTLGVGLTVLALSLAACSDDAAEPAPDAPESPAADAPESPDPEDTDPSEPDPVTSDNGAVEADRQLAERAILRLDDFPPGWQERVTQDEADEESQARIAECAGYSFEALYGGGEQADSPTFVSPQDQEVRSSATVHATDDQAARRHGAITDPGTIDCIADEMGRAAALAGVQEGFEVLDLEINRLSTSEFGNETYGYRIMVELSSRGMTVPVYFDIVGVRVGRVGVTVQASSTFSPYFIQDLEDHVETVVSRIGRDVG